MIKIRNYDLTDIKVISGMMPEQTPVTMYQYTTVIVELKDIYTYEFFVLNFTIPTYYFIKHTMNKDLNPYIDYLIKNFDKIMRINKIKKILE